MTSKYSWAEHETPLSSTNSWQSELLIFYLIYYIASGICFLSLFSILVIVMMPAQDLPSEAKKKKTKRFRSLSVSIDIEFPEHIDRAPVYYKKSGCFQQKQQRKSHIASDRFRTMSTNYVEKYRSNIDLDIISSKAKGLAMLRQKPETFPFQSLPEDCRRYVFSFLTATERGVSAQVCSDWNSLIKTPSIWSDVDFNVFPLCVNVSERGHECGILCYAAYKCRVKKFFRYLIELGPALRLFRCAFDIGDHKDGWLDLIQSLLRSARCSDLAHVDINWKETTAKPNTYKLTSATWSTGDYNDLMFNHRHRQRLFVKFFDFLVAAAPNIVHLILPFDWSDRTLRAIKRLENLEVLTLKQYFWLQGFNQKLLTQLIQAVPQLKRLVLEVWAPTGNGLESFMIESDVLEFLDISSSHGFYLERVKLPKLIEFRVYSHPLFGPLSNLESPYLACLYQVLCEGAPNLLKLNDLTLQPDWKDNVNNDLELLLKSVCSCHLHKSS